MNNLKKQQYITGVIGTLFGAILLIVAFYSNIKSLVGVLLIIFGVSSGGAGILSFFNPSVAEVLGQIFKNMAENQRRIEISQQQHKPNNSPQTGIVYGNLTNLYGTQSQDKHTEKRISNKDKIKRRLKKIKLELEDLKKLNYKEGGSNLSALKIEVKGIIHKIYTDNPSSAENRLIQHVFWMVTSSTKEEDFQRWYLEDINNYITTIKVMNNEMNL